MRLRWRSPGSLGSSAPVYADTASFVPVLPCGLPTHHLSLQLALRTHNAAHLHAFPLPGSGSFPRFVLHAITYLPTALACTARTNVRLQCH